MVEARLPRESMYELLRTPNYLTIQGERWQFCCKTPNGLCRHVDTRRIQASRPRRGRQTIFRTNRTEPRPGALGGCAPRCNGGVCLRLRPVQPHYRPLGLGLAFKFHTVAAASARM